jgi:hypothetical protein
MLLQTKTEPHSFQNRQRISQLKIFNLYGIPLTFKSFYRLGLISTRHAAIGARVSLIALILVQMEETALMHGSTSF